MSRRFTIHSSIYAVKDILFFFIYLGIVLCWIIPPVLQGPLLLYRTQLLRFSIYMSITLFLLLYLIRAVFLNLKNTVYSISEDTIVKRSPFKTMVLPLSGVSVFRFIHLPFGFGFVFLKTKTKKLHLPFLIDNLHELIQILEDYFIKEEKQEVYRNDEMKACKHQARIADFHLNQTVTIIKPLIYILFSFFSLGVITTLWFWNLPLLLATVWVIISSIIPCIGFLGAYVIITRRISHQIIRNGAIAPGFDTKGIYSITALITLFVYLCAGIIFKNFWIYLWW